MTSKPRTATPDLTKVVAENLADRISASLSAYPRQYVEHTTSPERAALVRKCGRAAGRRIGDPVSTHASDPARRKDGAIVVSVVSLRELSPDEQAESDENVRRAMDKVWQ